MFCFLFCISHFIRIYHTIVLDDPYDDPDGLEVPDKSPEPTKEQLDVSPSDWSPSPEVYILDTCIYRQNITLTLWIYVYFQTVRIGADEEVDDFKGMTEDEVREILEEKEAKANAQILEMVSAWEDIWL